MIDKDIQQIRNFNRFYTDLLGLLDAHLLKSQYSLAEGRILFEIFSNGQSNASEIIDRLSIDKGYLSRILKKLEKEGLIQRQASEADGRVALLSLSANGQEVFQELNAASNLQVRNLVEHLQQKELQQLTSCMRQIMDILKSN